MEHLNMSIEEINMRMKFNCRSFWYNLSTTNCYAYALGIDISENDIIKRAFQPGVIGSIIFDIRPNLLLRMSLEDRIKTDLEALNISFNECSSFDFPFILLEKDYKVYQWIVALFLGKSGHFHFMRKSFDGDWWHKCGYHRERPINCDINSKIINDPHDCNIGSYKYIKCLKLTYIEKDKL